jgi:hypothetical protein
MKMDLLPALVDRSSKILLLIVVASIAVPLIVLMASFNGGSGTMDIVSQALILVVVLPLLSLSVYMWVTGKGAMLVAGYNTSPKAVRDLYDSKAMAKFVGMLMTVFLAIVLVAMELLFLDISTTLFFVLLAAGIVFLVASLVYMNTGGRFLKEGADPSKVVITAKERKRNRNIVLAALGVTAIILVSVFLLIGSGSVSASLENDGLQVSAPFVDERIAYGDVTSVELRHGFDDGRRVGGFGGSEVSSGNFMNDEFGRYTLARYNDVESCIVVHHSGGVLAFNLDTDDGTARMYEDLLSRA